MRASNRQLREDYDWINQTFFRGKLPSVKISYAPIVKSGSNRKESKYKFHARTYFERNSGSKKKFKPVEIRIAPWLKKEPFARLMWFALVHEIVHVDLGPRPDCLVPGGSYSKRVRQLTRRGILDTCL